MKLNRCADALQVANAGIAIEGLTDPNIRTLLENLKLAASENISSERMRHKRKERTGSSASSSSASPRPLKTPRKAE